MYSSCRAASPISIWIWVWMRGYTMFMRYINGNIIEISNLLTIFPDINEFCTNLYSFWSCCLYSCEDSSSRPADELWVCLTLDVKNHWSYYRERTPGGSNAASRMTNTPVRWLRRRTLGRKKVQLKSEMAGPWAASTVENEQWLSGRWFGGHVVLKQQRGSTSSDNANWNDQNVQQSREFYLT